MNLTAADLRGVENVGRRARNFAALFGLVPSRGARTMQMSTATLLAIATAMARRRNAAMRFESKRAADTCGLTRH